MQLKETEIAKVYVHNAHTTITGIVAEPPTPLHYLPSGAAVRYIRIYGVCSTFYKDEDDEATPKVAAHSAEYELKLMNIAAELSDDLKPGDTIEATVLHYSTPADRYVAVDLDLISDDTE